MINFLFDYVVVDLRSVDWRRSLKLVSHHDDRRAPARLPDIELAMAGSEGWSNSAEGGFGRTFKILLSEEFAMIIPSIHSVHIGGKEYVYQFGNRRSYIRTDAFEQLVNLESDVKRAFVNVFEQEFIEYTHEFRNLVKSVHNDIASLYQLIEQQEVIDYNELDKVLRRSLSRLDLVGYRIEYYNMLSQVDNDSPQRMNIFAEVEQLGDAVNEEMQKKNMIFRNVIDQDIEVDIQRYFRHIVYILIDNAIKYSSDKSEIECNFSVRSDRNYEFTIENLGMPIAEDQDVFSKGGKSRLKGRTDEAYPDGFGFGLFIARGIVENVLNGEITFSQDFARPVNQGLETYYPTLFRFTVSLDRRASDTPSLESKS